MARDLSSILTNLHKHQKLKSFVERKIEERSEKKKEIEERPGSEDIKINFLKYSEFDALVKSGEIVEKISKEYGVPAAQVEELARDPDHGGRITTSSYIEAMVAFELEYSGILGIKISRGECMTDLQDGWQRKWDVKAPPKLDDRDFDFDAAIKSVQKKFASFPNGDIGIFLCVSFMTLPIYFDFQEKLGNALTENELLRVRQVEINGLKDSKKYTAIFNHKKLSLNFN